MSETGYRATADALLVERLSRGDREALAELYDRHSARVFGLALRLLGNREQAEDLVHEVFLEAWRHAAQYSEARGSVLTWLLLRTRSRGIDRKRAARQFASSVQASEIPDLPADPSRILDQQRALAALDCVSGEELQVITLGYFEGLSSSEIAQRLDLPIGTVKSRTRSALLKLRQRLEDAER
jgi:RNA polymerase sigma-70 factor (ECF subfamily)